MLETGFLLLEPEITDVMVSCAAGSLDSSGNDSQPVSITFRVRVTAAMWWW